MRILLYGINFAPELTGIGKYTGEMAQWLAQRGHEVRVVTAPPYYPEWRVSNGFSSWGYCREAWPPGNDEPLTVWRCPLWVPKTSSGIKRLIHLASFAASSAPVVLAQAAAWRPEIVFSIAPALSAVPAALMAARLCRAKAWLHVQDFEVDAAFDMGMLSSSVVRRVLLAFERSLLRRFNRVSTISERMVERLAAKGVVESKCLLFPNWADIEAIRPLDKLSSFRAELQLDSDRVVALYSGNLGQKQGLEILIEAARNTEQCRQLVWVIAGNGGARSRLEQLSAGLPNLRWLPLQPLERLNDLLNLADIHVLPQRADAADLVMPSKLTGMLASGRPVVATAPPETQVGQVVPGRGVLVPPGDADALARAVVELANDPGRRRELGRSARLYAEQNLDREGIMTGFEQQALALIAASKPAVTEGQ